MASSCKHGNLLVIEYDFFTSILRGYLHTKFEDFSINNLMALGQKKQNKLGTFKKYVRPKLILFFQAKNF